MKPIVASNGDGGKEESIFWGLVKFVVVWALSCWLFLILLTLPALLIIYLLNLIK